MLSSENAMYRVVVLHETKAGPSTLKSRSLNKHRRQVQKHLFRVASSPPAICDSDLNKGKIWFLM